MALRTNVAKLKDLLLKAGVIDEFQMRAAMGRLEQWGGRLTGIIVEMGFTDDETLIQALSKAMRLPVMHVGMVQRDGALLARVDAEFCTEHGIFPVSLQNRVATIAMSDPTELDTVDLIQARLNARVQIVIAPESEIRAAIGKHYRGEAVPATRRPSNKAREAHIEATRGEVFELDTTAPPKPGDAPRAPNEGQAAWMNKAPSANTMLDEFFDEGDEKPVDFSAEERKRLAAAFENQKKTTAILTALQALLAEKGFSR